MYLDLLAVAGGGASNLWRDGERRHAGAEYFLGKHFGGRPKTDKGGVCETGKGCLCIVRSSRANPSAPLDRYVLRLSSPRTHFEPWKAVGTRGRGSLAAR